MRLVFVLLMHQFSHCGGFKPKLWFSDSVLWSLSLPLQDINQPQFVPFSHILKFRPNQKFCTKSFLHHYNRIAPRNSLIVAALLLRPPVDLLSDLAPTIKFPACQHLDAIQISSPELALTWVKSFRLIRGHTNCSVSHSLSLSGWLDEDLDGAAIFCNVFRIRFTLN